jgi:enoyl-[acyl-carrier protein] reductase II
MKNNRICQILGIEKPVIQGPLSWLTDARLVAAVSNAGGLGVLGPNAGLTADTAVSTPEATAEKMREEIRKTKRLTEKPFGVNLIPTAVNDVWTGPILKVVKEEGVRAVVYTGYGEGSIIPALFNELKEAGIAIIYRDINPTPENTLLAEEMGADIIVATGFDEGGTLPATALGTFSIVPLIADAVKHVPVMAAGGITDNRTARAAHALGAEGVFAGSVFISTEESRVPQGSKRKLLPPTAWTCCFSAPSPTTIVLFPASWRKNWRRWIKRAQATKRWARRWADYGACAWACWKVTPMKAISRSARGLGISAA